MTIDIKKQPEAELCGLLYPAYRPGAPHPDTDVLIGAVRAVPRRSTGATRRWFSGLLSTTEEPDGGPGPTGGQRGGH